MNGHVKKTLLVCCLVALGARPSMAQRMALVPAGEDPNNAPFTIVALGGDVIVLDVYVRDSGVPVQSYQSTMPCQASGGTAGSIDFTSKICPDTNRADYIFPLPIVKFGCGGVPANCPDQPNGAGSPALANGILSGTSPVVTDWKYMGSWEYTVSSGAEGTFTLALVCHGCPAVAPCTAILTFIGDDLAVCIPLTGGVDPVTIHIGDPVECLVGAMTLNDPPDGVVDARQPHPVGSMTPLQGIDTLEVSAPLHAAPDCWSLCETEDGGNPNSIADVVDHGDGTYTISLDRPITPGAVTTLTYTSLGGPPVTASLIAHPSNVNGDSGASPLDILKEIDCVNGVEPDVNCPWGLYSCDANHSAECNSADILRVIDLLNGADTFEVWNGTNLPVNDGSCP